MRRRLIPIVAVAVFFTAVGLHRGVRTPQAGHLWEGLAEAAEPAYVPARPEMPLADIITQRDWEEIPHLNLLVDKSEMTLSIRSGDETLKRYPVALGTTSLARKQRRGDRLTPEGEYYICERTRIAGSRVWNAAWMRLSYPNGEDARRGLAAGIISEDQARSIERAITAQHKPPQHTRLGSGIGIHGGGISPRTWTTGCIALQHPHAVEIYRHTWMRTPVTIQK